MRTLLRCLLLAAAAAVILTSGAEAKKPRWKSNAPAPKFEDDLDVDAAMEDLFDNDSGQSPIGGGGAANPEEFLQRAMEADKRGNFEGAVRAFTEARKLFPDDATMANNHGVSLMRRGRDYVMRGKRAKGKADFVDAAQSFREALDMGQELDLATENLRAVLHALSANFRLKPSDEDLELLRFQGKPFEEFKPEAEPDQEGGGRGPPQRGPPPRGGKGGKGGRPPAQFDEEEEYEYEEEDGDDGSHRPAVGSGEDLDISDLDLDALLMDEDEGEEGGEEGDEEEDDDAETGVPAGGDISDDELDALLADLEGLDGGEGGGGSGKPAKGPGGGHVRKAGSGKADDEQIRQWLEDPSTVPKALKAACTLDGMTVRAGSGPLPRVLEAIATRALTVCGALVLENAADAAAVQGIPSDALVRMANLKTKGDWGRGRIAAADVTSAFLPSGAVHPEVAGNVLEKALGPEYEVAGLEALSPPTSPAGGGAWVPPALGLFPDAQDVPPAQVDVFVPLRGDAMPIDVLPGSQLSCGEAAPVPTRLDGGETVRLCRGFPKEGVSFRVAPGSLLLLDPRVHTRLTHEGSLGPALLVSYVRSWYTPPDFATERSDGLPGADETMASLTGRF